MCTHNREKLNAYVIIVHMIIYFLGWSSTETLDVIPRTKEWHSVWSVSSVRCVLAKRYFWRTDTSAIFIISLASLSPAQLRGPMPIGMKQHGGRPALSSFSNLQMCMVNMCKTIETWAKYKHNYGMLTYSGVLIAYYMTVVKQLHNQRLYFSAINV